MIDTLTPIKVAPLRAEQAAALDRDGYLLLRGGVAEAWRAGLREAFDAGVGTSGQWGAPRGPGWRHALVDLDPLVQRACRAPVLLAAAGRLVGGPFYFSQVEGREPLPGAGHQPLHRDGLGQNCVAALIFLDPYGPDNGATRVVPRHLDSGQPDEALAVTLAGEAGDILVFDADLLHGATQNHAGTRRRSLLLSFRPETDRAKDESTRALRTVRMDTTEVFAP
jgi:hypothetical protein